jgi:hypothetical protein
MRTQEFLKKEKEHYGKIFIDINYGIDNIIHFITEEELARRKYTSRIPILKKYINAIEAAEKKAGDHGFLSMFDNDKYTDLLQGFKKDHKEELAQLEKCSICKCLNCSAECKFESCSGCRVGSRVVVCDHHKNNVVFHDEFIVDLTNERTNADEKYMVLATLENIEKDKSYIVIEGIHNKEKFILYYYPGISEDNYGEITDEKEFASVVSAYESVERE